MGMGTGAVAEREEPEVLNETVLLVDDEPQVLESMKVSMGARQFDVDTASSGEAAAALVRKRRYRMAILDLVMGAAGETPTGVAIGERLRTLDPDLVFVLLSGRLEEEEWMRKAHDAGLPVVAFLYKPLPTGNALTRLLGNLRRAVRTRRFGLLADRWRHDTRFASSSSEIAMHPAYQQIVGMGRDALPLLLKALQDRTEHWFWALKAITGEDPVPPEDRGDLEAMRAAWLRWGEAKGYEL